MLIIFDIYAHTNMRVNNAMRGRIGDSALRDLTDAMAHIIAMNIKTLRLALRLKQTEFGELLDVSQGTVARWESGASPKNDALLRLANLAGVTPQAFNSTLISGLRDADGEHERAVPLETVMLPVQLPSEEALTAMFLGLLGVVAEEEDRALVARRLAQLLPNALARTVFRPSVPQHDQGEERAPSGAALSPATTNPAPPR